MICVNSASDWGESGPHNLTDTARWSSSAAATPSAALEIFHNNLCRFFGQSPKWKVKPVKRRVNTLKHRPPPRRRAIRGTGGRSRCRIHLERPDFTWDAPPDAARKRGG